MYDRIPTMNRRLIFLVVFSLIAPLFASDARLDQDRYVPLYERIVAQQELSVAKGKAVGKLWLAGVELRLAQRTGRSEYRDKAVALFDAALPEVAGQASDFHSLRGLALTVLPMRQMVLITPQHEQALRPIAARAWTEFLSAPDGSTEGDVDHNIRLAQAVGCAALVNFFNNDRSLDAGPVRKRLQQYWAKIKATGDLDEDASNYTGLGIVHCIELAQMLGRAEDLRAPGFRRMFERQRDSISTTGMLPEFGDGFFHLDRTAFDFLYLCEYAAAIFDDPTFLTVARRLFDPVAFPKAQPDEWGRAISLLDLQLSTRSPAPLPAVSLVNYRAIRTVPHSVPDKLILRTGNQPGDAMVLMDLYAGGSHSHPFKGPSIAYYEVDGVPLFHNLGRHRTRSAITGNSFFALEEGRAFPGVWKPGEWFTMSIPAEMMLRDSTNAPQVGNRITFRNFDNRGTRQVWFDNLRLEGKESVKLLDGFESSKTWHRSIASVPGVDIITSPEHTQGLASQSLNWGILKAGAYARMLANAHDFNFKPDDYDTLKFDVKYTGTRPYFHLRDLCRQIDLGDQALNFSVASASAGQCGRDACGVVVFSPYIGGDARLTRRIVLTAEGFLVVHDRWSSGKSHPKWSAGQLWQLYALKAQGADWFCGDDDGPFTVPDGHGGTKTVTRRMLVKFATGPDTGTFVEELHQPCLAENHKNRTQDRFFTTGSKRTVDAGKEASFSLIVIPNEPSSDPKGIAAGARFHERVDGVAVEVSSPATEKLVRVNLSNDGKWAVSRSPGPRVPGSF